MNRNPRTLAQIKSRWNKKLDALGLPRIARTQRILPKRFTEYLEQIQIAEEQAKQAQEIEQHIDQGTQMENASKIYEFIALQQAQGQIIINKLAAIESRLDSLELLVKSRNVDFDEQFEKIKQNLAELAEPRPEPQAAAVSAIEQPSSTITPIEVQSPTPAERRRVEPPEAVDYRRESLPDWVIQDLSHDFEVSAIKNMFERFKQYYYENAYTLPDYNGVKIKLRQWLQRAAENGEQVMSSRALAELERARIERARAKNTRRYEEHEQHCRAVSAPEVQARIEAGLDNILMNLGKNHEK